MICNFFNNKERIILIDNTSTIARLHIMCGTQIHNAHIQYGTKNMPSEIRRWLHKGTVELVRKFVLIWILKILLKW